MKTHMHRLPSYFISALSTNYGRLFAIVLLLKIGIAFFISPELYTQWFIPFVKNFITSGYDNPWNSFLAKAGHVKAFPYGTGMLIAVTIPFSLKAIISSLSPETVSKFDIFLMRIPVIIADLGILYILIHFFRLNAKKSIYIYWCSPIVFYISYIHGQLDIIPMVILLLSIVLLTHNRYTFSAVSLGVALATKANLLVSVPFLLVYIFRKDKKLLKAFLYLAITLAAYGFMIGFVAFSPGYQTMVTGAEERSWIFLSTISFGNLNILVVPLVIGFLYLKFSLYKKLNNDILIMYIGLAFTVLLIFIPANAPGWYMWIIPFLCYYYISNARKFHIAPLLLFSVLFIMFFLIKVPYPLNIIDPDLKSSLYGYTGTLLNTHQTNLLADLTFTFLHGITAYIAVIMYVYGVRSNAIYKERKAPIVLGIGGDSSAGKDTLCNSLKMILGPENIIQGNGDDHHKWERGDQMWKVYTHLNPKANDLFLQFDHTHSLRNGKTVSRRTYNHETGKFSLPSEVEPNKYIFISGLHPFYLRNMRELIDLRIYLDTDEKLRTYWKIKRDVAERGYTEDEVISSIKERENDSKKFIEPQKQYANIIIRYETAEELSSIQAEEDVELKVNISLDNSIALESLVSELMDIPDISVHHVFEDYDRQRLSVQGHVSSGNLHEIAQKTIPNIYELADTRLRFEDDLKGIVQVVILCAISYIKFYGKERVAW